MKKLMSVTTPEKAEVVGREDWQADVECNKCGDVIYSKYDGEFTTCKCGAISVDQTPYYTRYIGDPENFKR